MRRMILAVSTTALLAASATPAAAHLVETWHGSDRAAVYSDHDHLLAHDLECDGHSVYAQGVWWNPVISSTIVVTVWDTNGCSGSWEHGDGIDFQKFRVCEESEGCSPWKYVT